MITAKDKLRKLLGQRMKGICFSAEKADEANEDENGIADVVERVGMPVPSVYSAELSEFVFAAGVELMSHERRPDVMYLSTTDYVQHKHAPGTDGADAFYRMMDDYLGKLDAMGCTIVLTADHGMNAKTRMDSQPDVDLPAGRARRLARRRGRARDPADHRSRTSSTTARSARSRPSTCPTASDSAALAERICARCAASSRCARAPRRRRSSSCRADRIGDLIVVSERSTVIGTSAARHDLSGLDAPLRSHGGVSEQRVPLIVNRHLRDIDPERRWRNFDAFDLALNHVP